MQPAERFVVRVGMVSMVVPAILPELKKRTRDRRPSPSRNAAFFMAEAPY